jgi:hypothetical protein
MKDEIEIDGEVFVRKNKMASMDGMIFVIVRCTGAGVHFGYLKSKTETEVVLFNSRRMWRWYGHTLSGCAIDGTTDQKQCKFGNTLPSITLSGWCEIIPCSEKARLSLEGVAPWKND